MRDNTKILIALLAGIAAGAALGILYAPEKGSDTRDKLSDSLKNLGDSIKDRAAEEIENLSEFKDQVVENIRSNIRSAENDYTQAQAGASSIVKETERKINKVKNA